MKDTGEVIFLNGEFMPAVQAKVSVLSQGFLYGWGLFETMRAFCQNIVYLDQHLRRIKRSCALIGMEAPYSLAGLKKIIKMAAAKSAFKDARVKLNMWKSGRKTEIMVLVRKYVSYSLSKCKKGFCCAVSPFRQDEGSFLARIKSNNRIFYQLAYQEARARGFDEALLLNTAGYLAEASRSNVFFVKDNQVFTPSLASGCLRGITRQVVFDLCKKHGIKARQGRWVLQDLFGARAAFLTNSGMGIMPLASVEGKAVARSGQDEIVKLLIKEYQRLLKDEN